MKNLWTKINKESIIKTPSKGVKAYYSVIMAAMVLISTMFVPISAGTTNLGLTQIADTFKNIFIEIYETIMSIVTIIAVVLVAICLVIRMLSRSMRAAEEATNWIKRIVVSWLCLMLLNLFLQYGLSIVNNSGANTQNPWEAPAPSSPGGGGGGGGIFGGGIFT